MVSSYLPELFGICDRMAVMTRGVLSPARPVGEWTEATVMEVATEGVTRGGRRVRNDRGRTPTVAAARSPGSRAPGSSAGPGRCSARSLGLVGVTVLFAVLTRDSGSFLTAYNWRTIAVQTVIVGTAALGMTIIMIGGGIDLSVGSVVALVTVALARLIRDGGLPMPLALACGVGVGCLCGLFNGALITRLGVTPFIITLGRLKIFRGLAKWLSGSTAIYVRGEVKAVVVRQAPGDRAEAGVAGRRAWGLDAPGAERRAGGGAKIQRAGPVYLRDRVERGDRAALRHQTCRA